MNAEREAGGDDRTKTGQIPDIDASLRAKGWMPGQVDPGKAARMQEASERRRRRKEGPPDEWDALWVGERMTRSYRTLFATTGHVGPQGYSSYWPPILSEFEDLVAQVSTGEMGRGRNRPVRGAPIDEIGAMNKVILWPMTVLLPFPEERRILQRWAICKALNLPLTDEAARSGYSYTHWRRLRDDAANLCAAMLTKASVKPF